MTPKERELCEDAANFCALHGDPLHAAAIRAALAAPVPAAPPDTCEWTSDEDYCLWQTSCGRAWQFIDDGPVENKMHFCMGCGRPVSVPPKEPTR